MISHEEYAKQPKRGVFGVLLLPKTKILLLENERRNEVLISEAKYNELLAEAVTGSTQKN